jgi:hypothetical protein
LPSKIEIKLKKKERNRWTVLEGNPEKQEIQPISQGNNINHLLL